MPSNTQRDSANRNSASKYQTEILANKRPTSPKRVVSRSPSPVRYNKYKDDVDDDFNYDISDDEDTFDMSDDSFDERKSNYDFNFEDQYQGRPQKARLSENDRQSLLNSTRNSGRNSGRLSAGSFSSSEPLDTRSSAGNSGRYSNNKSPMRENVRSPVRTPLKKLDDGVKSPPRQNKKLARSPMASRPRNSISEDEDENFDSFLNKLENRNERPMPRRKLDFSNDEMETRHNNSRTSENSRVSKQDLQDFNNSLKELSNMSHKELVREHELLENKLRQSGQLSNNYSRNSHNSHNNSRNSHNVEEVSKEEVDDIIRRLSAMTPQEITAEKNKIEKNLRNSGYLSNNSMNNSMNNSSRNSLPKSPTKRSNSPSKRNSFENSPVRRPNSPIGRRNSVKNDFVEEDYSTKAKSPTKKSPTKKSPTKKSPTKKSTSPSRRSNSPVRRNSMKNDYENDQQRSSGSFEVDTLKEKLEEPKIRKSLDKAGLTVDEIVEATKAINDMDANELETFTESLKNLSERSNSSKKTTKAVRRSPSKTSSVRSNSPVARRNSVENINEEPDYNSDEYETKQKKSPTKYIYTKKSPTKYTKKSPSRMQQ